MRENYLTLVDRFAEDYPHLVINMTGPWKMLREGILVEDEEPWICTFQNMTRGCRQVHIGSRGVTMFEALRAGMDYLEANPSMVPDESERPRPATSPSP